MASHNFEEGLMKTSMVPERSDVAKDWHARGFTCGLWIDHAARTWNGMLNETEELFMVLSGKLELEVEGNRIQPEVGEEVLIPAQAHHTIKNIGGRTARWLYGQKLQKNLHNDPL
ncbi:MAG: cupin domain-containing protein [Nitrospirales bacterium]